MTERAADPAVAGLMHEADAAFAASDADRFAALFAEDARLYILYSAPLEGRPAIRDYWLTVFARFDTSAWVPRTELVETHGDRAYAFGTYTEQLHSREDGSRTLVRGRLVHFLRRDAEGAWRIWLMMNSHSHPAEPLP